MDSLRVGGALDAGAMEVATLNQWIKYEGYLNSTLSWTKKMLDPIKGAHVEVSMVRLYK